MKLNTFFDFCSGIGGGRLGLEQCGQYTSFESSPSLKCDKHCTLAPKFQ